MAQSHRLIVEQDNLRLDVYMASTGLISRTKARELLAAGGVYLNRHRVKVASRIVRRGDQVELYLAEVIPEVSTVEVPLLFQDRDLVVANKPADMPVQPTRETDRGTLLAAVRRQLGPGTPELKVVHRLDRDASGAVALAITREAAASLSAQMADHSAQRIYLAAAVGQSFEEETLRHYLTGVRPPPPELGPGPARVEARPAQGEPRFEERLAVAHVKRLVQGDGVCLLRVTLETGRTHQIRAQLAAAGLPLVGDTRYGAPRLSEDSPLQRMGLHAALLSVVHPSTGKPLTVFAPIPDDLQHWLEIHGLWLPWLDASVFQVNHLMKEVTHGHDQDQPHS